MLVGLVGKPSSGKSTLFSAATLIDVAIANYPFTTIEPNKGIGFVRVECIDKEFGVQCNPRTGFCKNHVRYVPVEMMDVAGLVPDAHKGVGMGNKFMDDLRQADALIHVVDASGATNEKGEEVPAGYHDPCEDVEFLEEEVDLWFHSIIQRNWVKFSKTPFESRGQMLEQASQLLSGIIGNPYQLEKTLFKLNLLDKNPRLWSEDEIMAFARELRKNSKPIIIAANKADKPTSEKNIEKMRAKFPRLKIIPCSGVAELALRKAARDGSVEYYPGDKDFKILKQLTEGQTQALEFIRKNVLQKYGSTGVQQILDETVFGLLEYKAIFPAGVSKLADQHGNILPDCFLMPGDATALDFAFKLHSDIGNNFIKAIDVKTRQLIGKEHVLKHRDAVEIAFAK
ncbi:MAG TPA: redox-regulated ATPase YchF [Candidatus Norongarragalinales archaeon]|nr:redox-regulated ATPase YchF [Candidatus Norongarragalinales archaeon]